MGGLGSGRVGLCGDAQRHAQPRYPLLARQGRLEPGYSEQVQLLRGRREVGAISLQRSEDILILGYWIKFPGSTGSEKVEERVPLLRTSQPLGGERLWFACPSCERRCTVLYGARRFRCRLCTGASYASQYEKRGARLFRRVRAIRARLGGAGSVFEPFPEKPKRMRWTTYLRLYEEAEECWGAGIEEAWRQIKELRDKFEALVGKAPAVSLPRRSRWASRSANLYRHRRQLGSTRCTGNRERQLPRRTPPSSSGPAGSCHPGSRSRSARTMISPTSMAALRLIGGRSELK